MSEVTIGGYVPGAIGRVFLRTFEGPHAARHLYEKLGFLVVAPTKSPCLTSSNLTALATATETLPGSCSARSTWTSLRWALAESWS